MSYPVLFKFNRNPKTVQRESDKLPLLFPHKSSLSTELHTWLIYTYNINGRYVLLYKKKSDFATTGVLSLYRWVYVIF